MKIGLESVLEKSKKPVTNEDEKSIILTYAYYLATKEYFKESITKKISRIFRLSKPKRVTVIAKIAYELKIIPFSKNEILIADSCSPCTKKYEIITCDTKSLTDCANTLQIDAKSIDLQSYFIKQLDSLHLQITKINKKKNSSPFLNNADNLVTEIKKIITTLDTPTRIPPTIPQFKKEASFPELLSNDLFLFLQNSESYVICLKNVKERVHHCSDEMILAIKEKYSTINQSHNLNIKFGWKINTFTVNDTITLPIENLIKKLNYEVKPEIDEIDISTKNIVGGLEQKYKLESNEITRMITVEINNIREDKKLLLEVLSSKEESLRNQVNLLRSEYNEAKKAYEDAENYNESLENDSYLTTERIERIGRYRREKDSLKLKLNNAEEEKRNISMDIKNTENTFNGRIQNHQKGLQSAIQENDKKRDMEINHTFEESKRKKEDKTAHIAAVKQDKDFIEELIKSTNININNMTFNNEDIKIDNLWNNDTLITLKIDIIQKIEKKINDEINETLKSINQTKKFLESHLINISNSSSVIKDLVIPFWYIEIESGSKEKLEKEVHIVSPSEISIHSDEKEIFNMSIIPTLPSLTSTLDSIKEYPNVQNLAFNNNIIEKLDPKEYLSIDHWIMKNNLVSQKICDLIHKEYNKKK